MKYILSTLLAMFFSLGIASAAPGYLTATNGEIVRDSYGKCIHAYNWKPVMSVVGCDPVKSTVPVTIRAEVLFAFDKADLSSSSVRTLTELITDAKLMNVDVAIVIGYTDKIGGNTKSNTVLSQRRADTVKKFLIAGGLSAERIFTEGKGTSDPVTGKSECGSTKTKANVDCLQSDRRVTVQIVGTRVIVR
jgi:OOP family OmpA-OmpF porin